MNGANRPNGNSPSASSLAQALSNLRNGLEVAADSTQNPQIVQSVINQMMSRSNTRTEDDLNKQAAKARGLIDANTGLDTVAKLQLRAQVDSMMARWHANPPDSFG
jgi:hypothetical protein